MRMHHRMPDMQTTAPIIWCQTTVQARAATLHHNSIQYTRSISIVHKSISIKQDKKHHWDEPNESEIFLEYEILTRCLVAE